MTATGIESEGNGKYRAGKRRGTLIYARRLVADSDGPQALENAKRLIEQLEIVGAGEIVHVLGDDQG